MEGRRWIAVVGLLLATGLSACGGSDSSSAGRTFTIQAGANATTDMVAAMVQAAPGDVIQFDCGYFELSTTLTIINTEDVRIRGCGRDQTVLSFRAANSAQGILVVNVHGITIQDLTVLDSGGNGIELRGVDHGTLQRVRAMWSSGGGRASADPITAANYAEDGFRRLNVPCTEPSSHKPGTPGGGASPDYTMDANNGRYAIYPVLSKNVLIEDSEGVGASDAGIYVGQSNDAIMRRNRAVYNPFGFEIENVQAGEYDGNLAECNTGGMLVYDLDGLTQYGERTRVHGNVIRKNNSYNVATHPGLVRLVPAGTGIITLGYDRIDVFDNEFRDNDTVGFLHMSYALFPKSDQPTDRRLDGYSEGVHLFKNRFFNNGNAPAMPTLEDLSGGDIIKAFPLLMAVKNLVACGKSENAGVCAGGSGLRGGHIMWDGLLDDYDADCPYPVDAAGNPLPKDALGKPIEGNQYPNPACHYNAYKFDTAREGAPRIKPDWAASCIDDDNQLSSDSLPFANFHGLQGLEWLIESQVDPGKPEAVATMLAKVGPAASTQFASDFDMAPHRCVAQYGANLPLLPKVTIPPFERSGDYDPAPSAAEVAKRCDASVPPGQTNHAAASVDCPTLDSYHLFSDPEDPRSAPNGGVPWVLTTKLFSDYAVKYRVAFLPPGAQASYNDKASNGVDATLVFPVGTILAKTFAFANETTHTETPVETRLLIKRVTSKGQVHWDGAAYVWSTDAATGKRVAKLALGGATAAPSWDYHDVDSGVRHAGATQHYVIPSRAQCLTCHSAQNKEPGASPIGLKVRFMNRPYAAESNLQSGQSAPAMLGQNQLQYWCSQGVLGGCPADLGVDATTQIASHLERIPVFNKPGDSGFPANSPQDVEARARAYLEVNCEHCHSPGGFAASTGLYLDSFRPIDSSFGICKQPTAAGQEGSGLRTYDIQPGAAHKSILEFRISPEATTPGAVMPPLARSVVHDEGHELIEQWIDEVVTADEQRYPGSTSCAGK